MTLYLPIKKQWFDMIKSGEKPEEYREITPYWIQRLCWHEYHKERPEWIIKNSNTMDVVKKHFFGTVQFRNGYQANSPILQVHCKLITIDTGNPAWGAEPDREYFVIKLGSIINKCENIAKKLLEFYPDGMVLGRATGIVGELGMTVNWMNEGGIASSKKFEHGEELSITEINGDVLTLGGYVPTIRVHYGYFKGFKRVS